MKFTFEYPISITNFNFQVTIFFMSTSITQSDVIHIAKLARLHLTPDEHIRMEKELSSILEYVGQLSEVDTEGVLPTTHVQTVMATRADEAVERDDVSVRALIDAAPAKEGRLVKVKAVFE